MSAGREVPMETSTAAGRMVMAKSRVIVGVTVDSLAAVRNTLALESKSRLEILVRQVLSWTESKKACWTMSLASPVLPANPVAAPAEVKRDAVRDLRCLDSHYVQASVK